MPRWSLLTAFLSPAILLAQVPGSPNIEDPVFRIRSFYVGKMDGRWECIGISEHREYFVFVDPKTIKFEKKISAWVFWCRQINLNESTDLKYKFAIRNDGEQGAIISSASYKFPSGELLSSWTASPKEMVWEEIIPDSVGENVWNFIKTRNLIKKSRVVAD